MFLQWFKTHCFLPFFLANIAKELSNMTFFGEKGCNYNAFLQNSMAYTAFFTTFACS